MFVVCEIAGQGGITGRQSNQVRNALLSLLAAVAAALPGAGCLRLQPCERNKDCGAAASCLAGSCIPLDVAAADGEGEQDSPVAMDALVVLPGLDAVAGRSFTLPLALDPTDLAIEDVSVDDCVVALDSVDAGAAEPVALTLSCVTLHLGDIDVALAIRSAAAEVAVALTLRLVPSDWHDLTRAERELVTVDVTGLLDGAAVPEGAPVFLAADRLPDGALAADPRLIAVEGGAARDVPFELDGHGLWFSLPSSARVWVYFGPVTGAPASLVGATPWQAFEGVWHLDDGADASIGDGRDDLIGEALPALGVIGGSAGFAGGGGLATTLLTDAGSGALSAWVKLAAVDTRSRQVAVGVGDDEAQGAFDPEGGSLYTDNVEQACAFIGSGDGGANTQQCSSGSPATLADDGWHHVAMRWSGATRELVVDGDARLGSNGTQPTGYDQEVLSIGAALDGNDPWVGAIDEVRFSSTPLPASWFRVEHASVTGLVTDAGRPFVQGLRPDLVVDSATVTAVGDELPAAGVVPALARGVLVTFVAARGVPASGAAFNAVSLSPLAPAAEGEGLSLTALSYEGALDASPLLVTHAGPAPHQAVIATVAFSGGSERGLAGVDLAAAPVVTTAPQLALAAAAPTSGAAWILVAVASRDGVVRCDACGRRVLGPIDGGEGLVLDVFAGEREPSAHVLLPITGQDDDAAVVVVRVGP